MLNKNKVLGIKLHDLDAGADSCALRSKENIVKQSFDIIYIYIYIGMMSSLLKDSGGEFSYLTTHQCPSRGGKKLQPECLIWIMVMQCTWAHWLTRETFGYWVSMCMGTVIQKRVFLGISHHVTACHVIDYGDGLHLLSTLFLIMQASCQWSHPCFKPSVTSCWGEIVLWIPLLWVHGFCMGTNCCGKAKDASLVWRACLPSMWAWGVLSLLWQCALSIISPTGSFCFLFRLLAFISLLNFVAAWELHIISNR